MPFVESWVDESLEPATARQYADLVKQAHRRALWLCSVRIPGRARYLAALDDAVHRAVRGQESTKDCLKAAADQWREVTADFGAQAQRAAYFRSLGMEP
jgi:hypothetical protein